MRPTLAGGTCRQYRRVVKHLAAGRLHVHACVHVCNPYPGKGSLGGLDSFFSFFLSFFLPSFFSKCLPATLLLLLVAKAGGALVVLPVLPFSPRLLAAPRALLCVAFSSHTRITGRLIELPCALVSGRHSIPRCDDATLSLSLSLSA